MQCKYFGKCGGCTLQHVPYEEQIEQKQSALKALLQTDIHVIHDEPFHYRNRMDFVFHPRGLGLRQKDNHKKIITIDNCPISEQRINTLLQELQSAFKEVDAFNAQKKTGAFRYAVLRANKTTSITFVLNDSASTLAQAIDKIKDFASTSTADNIILARTNQDVSTSLDCMAIKGDVNLQETLENTEFTFHSQGFFQNNTAMAKKMHAHVKSLIQKYNTKDAMLLDLYAGVGTFGIINHAQFKRTLCVEEFPNEEITNLNSNNNPNITPIQLDAKNVKKAPVTNPLYVITDPPRSGMHPKTIQALNAMEPEAIIYISCNPKQLAKELVHLRDYTIKSAALLDLFPQTKHMEAVVELVRK